jgi:hypothetical protein
MYPSPRETRRMSTKLRLSVGKGMDDSLKHSKLQFRKCSGSMHGHGAIGQMVYYFIFFYFFFFNRIFIHNYNSKTKVTSEFCYTVN